MDFGYQPTETCQCEGGCCPRGATASFRTKRYSHFTTSYLVCWIELSCNSCKVSLMMVSGPNLSRLGFLRLRQWSLCLHVILFISSCFEFHWLPGFHPQRIGDYCLYSFLAHQSHITGLFLHWNSVSIFVFFFKIMLLSFSSSCSLPYARRHFPRLETLLVHLQFCQIRSPLRL